jgi:hypothetical protein
MSGCTLEHCLKKFLNTEKVENYFCYRCWHGAALKYLSVIGAAEVVNLSQLLMLLYFSFVHASRLYLTRVSWKRFQSDGNRKAQELWRRGPM